MSRWRSRIRNRAEWQRNDRDFCYSLSCRLHASGSSGVTGLAADLRHARRVSHGRFTRAFAVVDPTTPSEF